MADIKDRVVVEPIDDVRSDSWRDLFFLRSGKSVLTDPVMSEAEAIASGNEMIDWAKIHPDVFFAFRADGAPCAHGREVSHFIAVPADRTPPGA